MQFSFLCYCDYLQITFALCRRGVEDQAENTTATFRQMGHLPHQPPHPLPTGAVVAKVISDTFNSLTSFFLSLSRIFHLPCLKRSNTVEDFSNFFMAKTTFHVIDNCWKKLFLNIKLFCVVKCYASWEICLSMKNSY